MMLPMEWIPTLDYFAGDPNQEYFDDGMKRSQKIKRNSNQNLYYLWSKDFLEAAKKRLVGDTVREATSDEVKGVARGDSQAQGAAKEAAGTCYSAENTER